MSFPLCRWKSQPISHLYRQLLSSYHFFDFPIEMKIRIFAIRILLRVEFVSPPGLEIWRKPPRIGHVL